MNQLRPLYHHRELIWEMTIRDLKSVNRGAMLGYLWLILAPLIQVVVYLLVVAVIFQQRTAAGPIDYALYILSGMIPWQILMRTLQEAPSLIRDRIELVTQVIFPIESLPVTTLVKAGIGAGVSLIIFLLLQLFTQGWKLSLLLLPIPILFIIILVLGISWGFAIVGVVIKDLREMVFVLLTLMVYISPVVIKRELVSEKMWNVMLLNPLSHVIIAFRDVLYGEFHPLSWGIFILASVSSFVLGGWVITRTKLLINEYI